MISKEKMLKQIDKQIGELVERFDAEELATWRAIRSLIEKFFEWQKRTENIKTEILYTDLGEFEDWVSKDQELDAMDLIDEIRDFGKEE